MVDDCDDMVSIIIPTHKRPSVLKEAIDSVFLQTYMKWEIIVVDDNDPLDSYRTETEVVLLQYDDVENVTYIKHDGQKGACAARNTGIANSSGKYVAFLDDDDVWFTNKIERQVAALQNDSEIGYVFCNMICQYEGGADEVITEFSDDECTYSNLIKKGEGVSTSSLMIRKDALIGVGGFDESLESYQDYDLLLRLSRQYNSMMIDEPLLRYRVSSNGISMNYKSKFYGKERVINKYKRSYEELNLLNIYGLHCSLLAQYAILSGDRVSSIKYYLESIKYRPAQTKSYVSLVVVTVGGEWLYRLLMKIYYKLRG